MRGEARCQWRGAIAAADKGGREVTEEDVREGERHAVWCVRVCRLGLWRGRKHLDRKRHAVLDRHHCAEPSTARHCPSQPMQAHRHTHKHRSHTQHATTCQLAPPWQRWRMKSERRR